MSELQVGQPALVINVEFAMNSELIGKCVTVVRIMSLDESIDYFDRDDSYVNEPYTVIRIKGDLPDGAIRTRYLMPIPPLDDDILDETNIKQPEGEKA